MFNLFRLLVKFLDEPQNDEISLSMIDEINPFESGVLASEDLPEEWGGRPTGSSRRAIRMQEEWDKKRERQLGEYKIMRQAYESDRSFYLQERQQYLQESRMAGEAEKEAAVQRLKDQQQEEALGAIQAFNALDPRSPEYRDQIIEIRKQYPLGALDPSIAAIFGEYEKANSVYMGIQKDQEQKQQLEQERIAAEEANKNQQLVNLTKLAKRTNRNLSDLVQSNPETGELIVDPVALGEAEADLATKPAVDPNAPTYRKESAKLREQLRQLDAKILANEADAERATTDKAKEEYGNNLNILTSQRNLIYSEYVGIQELLDDSGVAARAPSTNVTDAQIESAKKIAQDPNHPRNASAVEFLRANNIEVESTTPPQQPDTPQINMAPVQPPPPAAGAAPQPTPEQILQTSTDPLELAEASVQTTEQKSKAAKEAERQEYIDRVEKALAESPVPSPDIFNTPKAKEIASSPNARELAQQRYSDLQSAAFKGGLRTALPKKKDGISDDVFDKVLEEMLELRILLGDSPKDAQDLIDRIRSNK